MSSALRKASASPAPESPGPAGPAIEALEAALLGALLRNPRLMERLEGIVEAEHFSQPIAERVFMALQARSRESRAAGPITVADELGVYEWDRPEGADGFIEGLLASSLSGWSPEDAAAEVRAEANRRYARSQPYHEDVTGWAFREVGRLKELSSRADLADALDWPNLIEEIRSVGRSEVDGVARRIELVMVHAMKAVSTPDPRLVRGWEREIRLHLDVLQRTYAPSMRQLLNMDRLWTSASREAARDLDDHGERLARTLPKPSPMTLEQLLAAKDAGDVMALVTERLGPS